MKYERKGARKDNTVNNFTDLYQHLWDRSKPTIIEIERKIQVRPAKLLVATHIETMVERIFVEEDFG